MKTVRVVILDEDAGAAPSAEPSGTLGGVGQMHLGGLDPRALEGLSGSDAARLLRQRSVPLSFLDTAAGNLDDLDDVNTSLEDRLQEALRSEDESGQLLPVLLMPPREDAPQTVAPAAPGGPSRLNDSLMRVLRRHELEAALAESDARLNQLGLRDARCGLPRRELFLDRLEQAAIAVQRGGISFTLLMIGVELPSDILPAVGEPTSDLHDAGSAAAVVPAGVAGLKVPALQAVGNLLIEATSARLQRSGRRSDSYARIGGHSFAALLLGNSSVAASMNMAHRMAEDLARPVMVAGRSIQPVVTIGVALCPQHGTDARNLLLHAHAALEQAQAGRHPVAVYDPRYSRTLHSQGDSATVTLPLQGEALAPRLELALDRHDLGICLQPVVDLTSGRIMDLEVLARWHLPQEGSVAPREFIAVAEHHGLIARLTDQVLDQALAAARPWRAAGLEAGLSLNLSVLLLADRDWPTRLREALQRHDWPARALMLEVNAPALMQHGDALPEVMAELAAMGVRLAVDDFGNGLTSFLSVTELGSIDQLKIDLAALRHDARASRPQHLKAIVGAAVALGHGLGASVVIKGVEHHSDLAALHELGADRLQGRVLAAPMAPRQVRGWWVEQRSRPLAWQLPESVSGAVDLDIALEPGPGRTHAVEAARGRGASGRSAPN